MTVIATLNELRRYIPEAGHSPARTTAFIEAHLKRWERDPLLSVEERGEVAELRAAFERALGAPRLRSQAPGGSS